MQFFVGQCGALAHAPTLNQFNYSLKYAHILKFNITKAIHWVGFLWNLGFDDTRFERKFVRTKSNILKALHSVLQNFEKKPRQLILPDWKMINAISTKVVESPWSRLMYDVRRTLHHWLSNSSSRSSCCCRSLALRALRTHPSRIRFTLSDHTRCLMHSCSELLIA